MNYIFLLPSVFKIFSSDVKAATVMILVEVIKIKQLIKILGFVKGMCQKLLDKLPLKARHF
jgi:hypothetical protein